ncbi:MAG: HGGxSTG domain-containing protein [Telluria sp.]
MSDGYLSKDRQHLARQQRERRARFVRIDYTPNAAALAAINAKRGPWSPLNNNSGVLNVIVAEWTALTGINRCEVETPMTAATGAGINRPLRAPAYDFGGDWPKWADAWLAAGKAKEASRRVICGARRHRDGQPCQAKSQPGKRRCKWHGGCSTGPRTAEGKAKALANLRQNRGLSW